VNTKPPPQIPQDSGPTQTYQPTPDPSQPPSRRSGTIPPSPLASARSRRSEAETEARREGGEGNLASVIDGHLPSLYLFSAPTKNWPGARDLSRRNVGTADPRWEVSRHRRQPTFLRTKIRAPFARAAITLNTYPLPRRGWGGL
jgi:hypothetical protein